MKFGNKLEAKDIVAKGLRRYKYTLYDLNDAINRMWAESRSIKTVSKREEYVKKHFKRYGGHIYQKQVKAHFSNLISYLLPNDESIDKNDGIKLSRSKKAEIRKVSQKYATYQRSLDKQFFNVFVVKDYDSNDLVIFIFNPRSKEKSSLREMYSLANIKRHCLERVVERLNVRSFEEAIDEIVSSLQWLETSTKELCARSPDTIEDYTFERHIPTKNGALLLKNYTKRIDPGKPVQESHLITWIHKSQFYKGQEVTNNDFNFVQAVNYIMSSPNLEEEINKNKERGQNLLKGADRDQLVLVDINGRTYPWERYTAALEARKYLDFLIDFNKK
ncbi:hypothetical protein [Vibrio metschnikovii]|uniref:hypothetical protein n=1 Tax=Vibrio metschnikovii TaxID=28172 RepID=UPI001C3035DE|nr:hypothetical protein [Vibrio metschnikovii]